MAWLRLAGTRAARACLWLRAPLYALVGRKRLVLVSLSS